jgi:hypothetical protein
MDPQLDQMGDGRQPRAGLEGVQETAFAHLRHGSFRSLLTGTHVPDVRVLMATARADLALN